MSECEYNTKYGQCRCCFAMGNHRDVMTEYEWNGTHEVYIKIFLECFNIFLCTTNSRNTLICSSCVLRLREATSFKKMVLDAEQRLFSFDINQEERATDAIDSSKNLSMCEIDIKDPDDNFEPSDAEQNGSNSEDYTKLVDREAKDDEYIESIQATFCKIKNNNRIEKLAYIYNTTVILENSNVTPFKPKYQTSFPCFYCSMLFEDLNNMRLHQEKHTKTELKNVLQSQGAEKFVVYVDVTDLKCTICYEPIPSLVELKLHLIKIHNKKMQECPDRVVPFKISSKDYECQVCKCNFETFGAIERHMNNHFRNYICKECGTGYVTKSRLKAHTKQHAGGTYQCETCKKVYTTPTKLKNHIDVVHNMVKRFKCTKCDERFNEYFKRQKHLVDAHGLAKLEYKCNVCDKVFKKRYVLSTHMKRNHMEQKDYQCEMCSYSCFSGKELKIHMIKHNGERIYEFSVCKKSYARKKTLSEHMRIHNNDRRYVCKVCGQAFVQNCSLKGHIKNHHTK